MTRTISARLALLVALVGLLALPDAGAAAPKREQRPAPGVGPCTEKAAPSMPEGEDHDHLNIDQHPFRCRLLPVFVDPLTDELASEPNVVLGEENSLDALVTTWTNPANQEVGHIEFSPHNQQVVGNKIYLSHYHGGVYVLDATLAFRGRDVRPAELAFAVPHEAKPTRPISEPFVINPVIPFIRDFSAPGQPCGTRCSTTGTSSPSTRPGASTPTGSAR